MGYGTIIPSGAFFEGCTWLRHMSGSVSSNRLTMEETEKIGYWQPQGVTLDATYHHVSLFCYL
jgi:hypothetical protein